MSEISKFFDIAFDCLSERILILDSARAPIYANPPFLKTLSELTGSNISLKEIESLISDLKIIHEDDPPLREFYLDGSKEKLKAKIDVLQDGKLMLRIIDNFAKEDLKLNLHSQRIKTLGMLAGGIAHDFNNILTGILGHITYLKTILPQTGNHVVSLSAIEEGARRASSLTREILNFSRLETGEKPQRIELGGVVERTYHLLRGAISPEFELEYNLPEKEIFVLANEAKLAQVLVNLAMNARDAIASGGYIKINLESIADSKKLSQVFAGRDLSAKEFACLTVEDNGHGIPKEVLRKIFEPYYSTKSNKGNGFGLAIVNEVVRMFGGAIDVHSEENRGTSISVYLPQLMETRQAKSSGKNASQPALEGGKERILVVDDEYPVRNVLCLSLEHLGYEVAIASSGSEALELYAMSETPYDLVILDMLMPNMSGDQTFFRLKEIDTNVQVLVISGYSSQEAVDSILANGGRGFIQKPFTITELAKRVRACFDK